MTVTNQGDGLMDTIIKALRCRKDAVQARIDDENARPAPDQLRLSELKRMKLRFREQIEFMERMDRRGEMTSIPVVRRRSLRAVVPGRV